MYSDRNTHCDKNESKLSIPKGPRDQQLLQYVEELIADRSEQFTHLGYDLSLESPDDRFRFVECDYVPAYSGGGGSDPMFGPEPAEPAIYVPSRISAAFRLDCEDGNSLFLIKNQAVEKDSKEPVGYGDNSWRSGNPRFFTVKSCGQPNYEVIVVDTKVAQQIEEKIRISDYTIGQFRSMISSENSAIRSEWHELANRAYEDIASDIIKSRKKLRGDLEKAFNSVFSDFPNGWINRGKISSIAEARSSSYKHANQVEIEIALKGLLKDLKICLKLSRHWNSFGKIVTEEDYSMEVSLKGTNDRSVSLNESSVFDAVYEKHANQCKRTEDLAERLYQSATRKVSKH